MTSLPALRNLGLTALVSLTLGGCYYGDVNSAYYADGDCYARYGDQYWVNDPYAYDDGYYGYDCYDGRDYQTGFVQIGFGGGWYQQLYYPGHGLFLFDRYGRRHAFNNDHLTYWGGRRAWWKHHGQRFREQGNRWDGGRRGDGRYDGRRDGSADGRQEGRRPGRGYGQGGPNADPGAAPAVPGAGGRWNNGNFGSGVIAPAQRQRGDGVRGEGRRGDGRRGEDWRGRPRTGMDSGTAPGADPVAPVAVPDAGIAPPPRQRGEGWRGRGGAQPGGGNWMPPAADAPPASAAPRFPREPRGPRNMPPIDGDAGAVVRVAPPPARGPSYTPPPAPAPEASYTPPPPVNRARDADAPIRED